MADKPLTKSQISAAVAEANGITKKEATDLLEAAWLSWLREATEH